MDALDGDSDAGSENHRSSRRSQRSGTESPIRPRPRISRRRFAEAPDTARAPRTRRGIPAPNRPRRIPSYRSSLRTPIAAITSTIDRSRAHITRGGQIKADPLETSGPTADRAARRSTSAPTHQRTKLVKLLEQLRDRAAKLCRIRLQPIANRGLRRVKPGPWLALQSTQPIARAIAQPRLVQMPHQLSCLTQLRAAQRAGVDERRTEPPLLLARRRGLSASDRRQPEPDLLAGGGEAANLSTLPELTNTASPSLTSRPPTLNGHVGPIRTPPPVPTRRCHRQSGSRDRSARPPPTTRASAPAAPAPADERPPTACRSCSARPPARTASVSAHHRDPAGRWFREGRLAEPPRLRVAQSASARASSSRRLPHGSSVKNRRTSGSSVSQRTGAPASAKRLATACNSASVQRKAG